MNRYLLSCALALVLATSAASKTITVSGGQSGWHHWSYDDIGDVWRCHGFPDSPGLVVPRQDVPDEIVRKLP